MPATAIHHFQIAMPRGEEDRGRALLEGYDRAYVNDPFGNRIELLERR